MVNRHQPRDWNPKRPEVPVDEDGNWLSYPGYGQKGWEEIAQPFYAEFVIDGMTTGRSSKLVILRDIKDGFTAPMFVADMVKGVQQGLFRIEQREDGGRLIGYWTGSKRGANYGIKAVEHGNES